MSRTAKFGLFLVALLSMASLAAASVAMAQKWWWLGACLFVVGFLLVSAGFVARRKIFARTAFASEMQEN